MTRTKATYNPIDGAPEIQNDLDARLAKLEAAQ